MLKSQCLWVKMSMVFFGPHHQHPLTLEFIELRVHDPEIGLGHTNQTNYEGLKAANLCQNQLHENIQAGTK